jgi:hypothetical protein
VFPRERRVRCVVAAELFRPLVVLEQVEGGKGGELEALVEDQRRLDAAVGDEEATSS